MWALAKLSVYNIVKKHLEFGIIAIDTVRTR